jgi:hypothetical protein
MYASPARGLASGAGQAGDPGSWSWVARMAGIRRSGRCALRFPYRLAGRIDDRYRERGINVYEPHIYHLMQEDALHVLDLIRAHLDGDHSASLADLEFASCIFRDELVGKLDLLIRDDLKDGVALELFAHFTDGSAPAAYGIVAGQIDAAWEVVLRAAREKWLEHEGFCQRQICRSGQESSSDVRRERDAPVNGVDWWADLAAGSS